TRGRTCAGPAHGHPLGRRTLSVRAACLDVPRAALVGDGPLRQRRGRDPPGRGLGSDPVGPLDERRRRDALDACDVLVHGSRDPQIAPLTCGLVRTNCVGMVPVPAAAIELVKRWEGFRAKPYLCPAGVPTIGYGTVIDSLDHPPITEAEGERLLIDHLARDVLAVYRLCPTLVYEPGHHKIAALASFTYNLGAARLATSTLRRKVNAWDWDGAAEEFHKWVWAGGRKLPGLIARRAE